MTTNLKYCYEIFTFFGQLLIVLLIKRKGKTNGKENFGVSEHIAGTGTKNKTHSLCINLCTGRPEEIMPDQKCSGTARIHVVTGSTSLLPIYAAAVGSPHRLSAAGKSDDDVDIYGLYTERKKGSGENERIF